jgi:SNF family Na+-dependent transporter
LNGLTGCYAGVIAYCYLGHYSHVYDIPIEELPIMGPSLVFQTYPAILTGMPFPNLWLVVFFLCLILIGIDSQFGVLENIFDHV